MSEGGGLPGAGSGGGREQAPLEARQQRGSAPAPPASGHESTARSSVWLFHLLTAYSFQVAPKLAGGKRVFLINSLNS